MVANNTEVNGTRFTVSIDGSHEATGVTTGVSAFDRSATLQHLANPNAKATDFVHPGHSFPLIGEDGGVMARDGHTEAAIDLARLAGGSLKLVQFVKFCLRMVIWHVNKVCVNLPLTFNYHLFQLNK